MNNPQDFFTNLLNGKKTVDTKKLSALYKRPVKDVGDEAPTLSYITPGYIQHADTLYLRNDKGNIYALIVVDQGSREVDAAPLKDRTPQSMIDGFKAIWNRKILKQPKSLVVDSGTEYKGKTAKYLESLGINIKTALPGRSRQVSLAERKNQTVAKMIHKFQAYKELNSGVASSEWVKDLPVLIAAINVKVKEKMKDIEIPTATTLKQEVSKLPSVDINKPIPTTKSTEKIEESKEVKMHKINDKVRVQLDKPIDPNGNVLNGAFRSSDIRWNPQIRTIGDIIMSPNKPILYMLNSLTTPNVTDYRAAYTYNQLQKVIRTELPAVQPVNVVNPENIFELEKIVDRRKKGRSFEYKVKWKNYTAKHNTWEPRKMLVEDLGEQYMKRADKRFDKKVL